MAGSARLRKTAPTTSIHRKPKGKAKAIHPYPTSYDSSDLTEIDDPNYDTDATLHCQSVQQGKVLIGGPDMTDDRSEEQRRKEEEAITWEVEVRKREELAMRKEQEANRQIQELKRQVVESTLRGSQASVGSSIADSSQSQEASESWQTAADGGFPSKQLPSPVPTTLSTIQSSISLNLLEGYEGNMQHLQSSGNRNGSDTEENLPKAKNGGTLLWLDGFENPLVREIVQKG
ncbi:hypothetical protein BDD12DRAFT_898923 [Trichophaea hybrida]|nr:hypothetical protein BDD12DRAFT_898923 [Trichophaea hybrida]